MQEANFAADRAARFPQRQTALCYNPLVLETSVGAVFRGALRREDGP